MATSPGLHYKTLDHWRGFAALSVVFFHVSFPWINGPHPAGSDGIVAVVSQGWKGVHLFFVISGYCIALLADREIQAHRGSARFLLSRCLRIFPPYWAACLLAAVAAVTALPFNHGALLAVPPTAGALPGSVGSLLKHALLLDPLYGGTQGYLLVAWTLSWELSFYLFTASLILIASFTQTRVAIGLGFAAATAGCFPAITAVCPVLGGWTEFICGGCAFAAIKAGMEHKPGWPWLVAIAALGLISIVLNHRAGMQLVAALFAFILYGLRPYDDRLADLRVGRWLGAVGIMSYSLYLTHVPIVSPLVNLSARFIPTASLEFLLPLLFALGCSLVVAWIFFRWVETPLERWRKSFVWLKRPSAPSLA